MRQETSFFTGLLESGHIFDRDEILLKFQYRVLNTILLVIMVLASLFAINSILGINPLGKIHTIANIIYAGSAAVLFIRLRGPKDRYIQSTYLMCLFSLATFTSALLFVPHDEFRIIWFYLVVFAAYITGGVRTGSSVTIISIFIIILANIFYELLLSETAIVSAVLGLVIASLLIRSYTKKITDFEQEITSQQDQLSAFNQELEKKVLQKTEELRELNASLESKVEEKVAKIAEQEGLMISQSRLATMGEMISMIAHQWRQPLSTTTLLITNERLKAMIAGDEPTECDKLLEKISDTLVYLSDTIDDFQTYFKPNKKTEKVDVNRLIKRVEQFIEPRIVMNEVTMHIEQCEVDTIETYASEVVQVLINIVNNAIDALLERRTEDRKIWIRSNEEQEHVVISIEDTAGGVETAIMEKIFEPYFSQKSKNGTGLGLYMAKMIIEKHIGGELNVHNTDNGACFSIVLPKVPFSAA